MTTATHTNAHLLPTSHPAAAVRTPVAVAAGDGIGPEIMDAVLSILAAAEAPLDFHHVRMGKAVYEQGHTAGIAPETWNVLRQTQVLLKGPITTPCGGGYKSLNVTARKTLGLFANVRPCVAYSPFIATSHPGMNVVIVRENEEDTYGGIEHRQTREVTQCLKLITRPGCERIHRYAFEYARRHGRRKVTCMVKDNIMKVTDGLFRQVFEEVAAGYPDIAADTMIIDIGAARLADAPEQFDVIVTPNLYGDIISDIAAEIAGSVGLAGSANIGQRCAMFEAIHGSAPDIAGQGIANPSGLLLAAVQMLVHLGHGHIAEKIHNALLKTLEDGIHTGDVYQDGTSREKVGTKQFAEAVIARLSSGPQHLEPAHYASSTEPWPGDPAPAGDKILKKLEGVDVFLDWDEAGRDPQVLGEAVKAAGGNIIPLRMITNRGTKVYPDGLPETFCTDHWRCRFAPPAGSDRGVTPQDVVLLLTRLIVAGFDVIKTENLYSFDGERGYSLGQGE